MDIEIFHEYFNGKKISFQACNVQSISEAHELTISTKGQLKPTLVGSIEWKSLKNKNIREKEMYILNIQNGSLLLYHQNTPKNFIQNRIDIELINEDFKYDIFIKSSNPDNKFPSDMFTVMFISEYLSEGNKVFKTGEKEFFSEIINMYDASDPSVVLALIEKITGINNININDSTLFDYYKIK